MYLLNETTIIPPKLCMFNVHIYITNVKYCRKSRSCTGKSRHWSAPSKCTFAFTRTLAKLYSFPTFILMLSYHYLY